MECHSKIVTGDIIFVSTDWEKMHSSDEDENDCLKFSADLSFKNVFNFSDSKGNINQLDIFSVNEPQLRIRSNTDNFLSNQNKVGNAKCSGHYPFRTKFFVSVDKSETNRLSEFALNKVNWQNQTR